MVLGLIKKIGNFVIKAKDLLGEDKSVEKRVEELFKNHVIEYLKYWGMDESRAKKVVDKIWKENKDKILKSAKKLVELL